MLTKAIEILNPNIQNFVDHNTCDKSELCGLFPATVVFSQIKAYRLKDINEELLVLNDRIRVQNLVLYSINTDCRKNK